MSIGKAMPHVIFFKKVNKRSIVNYENENFPKYLLDFKGKLTTNKNVRVSYRRKNNSMGKIGRMEAQLNKMSVMMEKFIKDGGKRGPKNNGAGSNGGTSIDKSELDDFLRALVKALQDRGFLPKKPLSQRNADNGNSAPTPDETPASVKGPVTVLYGLRKLKEKIANANFVVENLPAFNAVATGPNTQVGNVPLDSWRAQDVSNIRVQYEKLAEVVRELKSLMAPLTLDI